MATFITVLHAFEVSAGSWTHLQDSQQTVVGLLESCSSRSMEQLRQHPDILRKQLKLLMDSIYLINPEEPLSASLERVLNLLRIAKKRYIRLNAGDAILVSSAVAHLAEPLKLCHEDCGKKFNLGFPAWQAGMI